MAQLWARKLGGTATYALKKFVILVWVLQGFSFGSVGCGCSRVINIPSHSATNWVGDTSGPTIARLSEEVKQLKDTVRSQEKQIKDLEEEGKRLRSITEATFTSVAATYKLRFVEPLTKRVYLGHPITSTKNKPIRVELVDPANGNQRVTSGVLSSLPVEMVPLKRKGAKWDAHCFSSNTPSLAENHTSVLEGGTNVTLDRGYAEIPGAMFRTFPESNDKYIRIGIRVDPSCQVGPTILEAASDELKLLCYRSKANQKPNTPMPDAPVWQLKGIGKNGPFHKALNAQNIYTTKDFLRMLTTQPAVLREIADNSGERGKMRGSDWNKIKLHAEECSPDPDEFYSYHCNLS